MSGIDAASRHWTIDEAAAGSVVIHVPHAGTVIPEAVRSDIVLSDGDLRAEIVAMTDHCTDRIALRAAAGCGASVFANRLSRLVVDPERFPDEREEMLAVGMGAVYTLTSQLQPLRHADCARDARLIAEYFRPYASAFEALVDRVVGRCGRCTIIDLHSYSPAPLPYELHQDAPRPGACIGTDVAHTPEWLREAALAVFSDVEGGAACDTPFSGTYVPDRHFHRDGRVRSVMVELRRDLYMDARESADESRLSMLADRVAGLARVAEAGAQ